MKFILKYIPLFLIVLTWESIAQWVNFDLFLGGWWINNILKLLLPLSFLIYYYYCPSKPQKTPIAFKLLFAVLIFSTVYGIFMVEGYQDFQLMVIKLTAWLLCLGWFYFQYPSNIAYITRIWCKVAIPIFFLLVLFMQGEAVGRYFAPFAFLLIFLPYLEKKWRRNVIIVVVFILVFGALGARSNMLRIIVAAILAVLVFFERLIPKLAIKVTYFILIISPIVLLYLGIKGEFNIFQIQEELGWKEYMVNGSFDKNNKENITADTRTFLYVEELKSAIDNNYIILGRSFGRGYDSKVFDSTDWKTGRNERWSCEVRMLNVFNYMGLLGVIIVSLIYIIGSYKAVFHSRSFVMQVIGVYVAFRWLYSWVEDFDRFDLINLYLWIPIIMCYSNSFLSMTDNDFRNWAKGIFKN